ncbi:hypothetical protein WR25_07011 [Diploscapter pachys]|uniref:Uncharacterized protein n=1 Tax=Diploscapter pachys TaxID=2018661 RepID=A0A2A2M4U7_9BILA|nr:hypothetical protein WR25_07011 [Diploscapter pachys]
MGEQAKPPLWLNLDYLSAEDWVDGCHGLPSPQANGLRKFFFFPGFTEKTGGLLREAALLPRCQAFRQAPNERASWATGSTYWPKARTPATCWYRKGASWATSATGWARRTWPWGRCIGAAP